jgi:hypothetical protein
MRTTVTLDEDVAAKLQREVRRSKASFKEVLNDALRRGLNAKRPVRHRVPFRIVARDLGRIRPGINLDNIAEVLDAVEGPHLR